jgi:hypothetical protein
VTLASGSYEDRVDRVGSPTNHLRRLVCENAPGMEETNPTAVSPDERDAEADFQVANCALDGRHAQVEGFGGSSEMLELREGNEDL